MPKSQEIDFRSIPPSKSNLSEIHISQAKSYDSLSVPLFSLDGRYGAWYGADVPLDLPRTQLSLSRWRCARKGRREGDNRLRLPSVPFPWSLAVHHQSLACTLRKTKRPRRRLPLDRVRFRSLCPKDDVYYRASLSSLLINEQMNSSAYTIHEIYFSLLWQLLPKKLYCSIMM